MSAAKPRTYATEAELCAEFMPWARRSGYQVFPETAGWDIVLVDSSGFQTGVEAKKRMNLDVIGQALRDIRHLGWGDHGPDHRAVLVPNCRGMADALGMVGIAVFEPTGYEDHSGEPAFHRRDAGFGEPMFDWNPAKRLELPPVEFDGAAGIPSPSGMTEWKLRALRIIAILETRGHVTRRDFQDARLSPTRWMSYDGWLVRGATRGQWVRGALPRIEETCPEVYARIKSDLLVANDNTPVAGYAGAVVGSD